MATEPAGSEPVDAQARLTAKPPRVGWALPPELVAQIVQLAGLHHRTITGEATVALKAWAKKHAKELKSAREKI